MQVPSVLNVVPTQASQAVLAVFGPCPAAHAVQLERSGFTTFGAVHGRHENPLSEKFVPVQLTHVDRSALGSDPDPQLSHALC